MESNPISKVRTYVILGAAVAAIMLVCVVAVAISGLRNGAFGVSEAADSGEKAGYLNTASLNYEKVKSLSKDFAIYSDDSERLKGTEAAIANNINVMLGSLDSYMAFITLAEEQEAAQRLSSLLSEYNARVIQMTEMGKAGDTEAVKAMLSETAPITAESEEFFMRLSDLGQAQMQENAAYSERNANYSIVMLMTVAVLAVILIIVISLLAVSAVSKLPDMERGILKPSAFSPNRYEDTRQAELERCISDLKAVAFDLSQSVRDMKK